MTNAHRSMTVECIQLAVRRGLAAVTLDKDRPVTCLRP